MRGFVTVVSAGCAAMGLVACGLTADYSNLQDGTRAAGDSGPEIAPDSSAPPALDDAGGDATLDAGVDTGSAGDASDAAPPTFCESLTTPVQLCTDFDEGQPVDAGWGAPDLYGGASISVSTTAFTPPGSFLSTINPGGAPSSARLLQAVPTLSSHVHVDFEMLLVPSDGTFELAVVHQVIADGTTYGLFYREVDSALQVELKTLFDDGGIFDQTWMIGAPPANWTRVVIDVDVSDSASFTVQQGGAVVVTATDLPTSTHSRTAMFVELGFYSFAPASGQANFDNTIVDWPP